MTLSDSEPVTSDAPTLVPTVARADPSSGSDIREVVNGKRVTNNLASNVNQSSGSDILELVDDTRVKQEFVKPLSNANNSTDSEILELSNGKRTRVANGSPNNDGEGSTSRLPADVPAAKRSRHASPVILGQSMRKGKSTARKTSVHWTFRKSLFPMTSRDRDRSRHLQPSDYDGKLVQPPAQLLLKKVSSYHRQGFPCS